MSKADYSVWVVEPLAQLQKNIKDVTALACPPASIRTFHNARDASEALRQATVLPDAMLIDIDDLNGSDCSTLFCDAIAHQQAKTDIGIIVLSQYPCNRRLVSIGADAGARIEFVQKPGNYTALQQTIEQYLPLGHVQ